MQKGFPKEWVDMVMKIVTSGKVGIKVNGERAIFPHLSRFEAR